MSREVERATQWMYRGIWGILTRWFRVPEHPPTLPAMPGEVLQAFRPSPDYLRYSMMFFWISTVIYTGMVLVAWFAFSVAFPLLGVGVLPVALLLIVVPTMVQYLSIHLSFDTTWYVLSQRSMRIRSGIWVIREATITFENIQNVTVESGPIERIFKIGNVVVDTAGGGGGQKGPHGETTENLHRGELAGVSNATEIRKLILSRLNVSKFGGLGDEHGEGNHAWSSEQIAVLRDIRDSLKA